MFLNLDFTSQIFVSDGEFREYLDLHRITVPGALVLRKGEGSEFSCPIDRLTLANCIAEDIKVCTFNMISEFLI